jgi:hypothetical protein
VIARLRPFLLPLAFAGLALVIYNTRISREMPEFAAARVAATHVLAAQPLYGQPNSPNFSHLPIVALIFAPFAGLGADVGEAIWFALSMGLVVSILRWSVRGLPERRLNEPWLIALTGIAMAGFFVRELVLGQPHLLMGALLIAAILIIQIDLPRAGAVLIGIAAWIEPATLVLVPWLGFTQGVAAAAVTAGVFAAGLAVPMLWYGWGGNIALLDAWFHAGGAAVPGPPSADASIAAFWTRWIGTGVIATAAILLTTVDALAAAGLVWIRRRLVHAPEYLEFAQLLILIPLFSPQGRDHLLLLATPGVVFTIDRWREHEPVWRGLAAAAIVILAIPITRLLPATANSRVAAASVVTVAALSLFAVLCRARWKALG